MQEVFEKIIEHLENASFWTDSSFDEDGYSNDDSEEVLYLHEAIEIVIQEAEQYNVMIDGEYCFQSCGCTEMCGKCSRIANGDTDYYESICAFSEQYNKGWIPVSEKLPEESLNSVIGWDEYRERCCFVQYIGGRFVLGDDTEPVKITHWMYLPYQQKGE